MSISLIPAILVQLENDIAFLSDISPYHQMEKNPLTQMLLCLL